MILNFEFQFSNFCHLDQHQILNLEMLSWFFTFPTVFITRYITRTTTNNITKSITVHYYEKHYRITIFITIVITSSKLQIFIFDFEFWISIFNFCHFDRHQIYNLKIFTCFFTFPTVFITRYITKTPMDNITKSITVHYYEKHYRIYYSLITIFITIVITNSKLQIFTFDFEFWNSIFQLLTPWSALNSEHRNGYHIFFKYYGSYYSIYYDERPLIFL